MNILYDPIRSLGRERQYWLAISGGIDSMVLLDVCYKAYKEGHIQKPKVLHVNHNLHKDSKKWADLVLNTALDYGLDVLIEEVELKTTSIEKEARELRYQAMFKHSGSDVLLTAHHLDDQKETFLFRAFRGTGLKGLVGIRKVHRLNGHTIIRPFYKVPKSVIRNYAKEENLIWVEDPSNESTIYKRNEIRKALSMINNTDSFALTLMHLQRQSRVFTSLLEKELESIKIEPHILSISKLQADSDELQLELFHHWLSQYETLSYHRTQAIFEAILNANEDRYPMEKIGEYHLLRYRDTITVLKLPSVAINITTNDKWVDLGVLGKIHNPNANMISVTLLGSNKGKYKKKLQEMNIPLWLRAYIPLIDGKLATNVQKCSWKVPKEWQYWYTEVMTVE